MIRQITREEIPECVSVIRRSFQTVADALGFTAENAPRFTAFAQMHIGIVEENKLLRAWYERYGFIHLGTKRFDFFPFTCGYMVYHL